MPTITRSFGFDYGHRILGHEGKCASLHGHRGTAEITFRSKALDHLGRVIDFGKVKEVVGQWIDDNLDHRMILKKEDPLFELVRQFPGMKKEVFGPREPMVVPWNPTAENIAECLFTNAHALMERFHITVLHVRLYETPNCWADYYQFDGDPNASTHLRPSKGQAPHQPEPTGLAGVVDDAAGDTALAERRISDTELEELLKNG